MKGYHLILSIIFILFFSAGIRLEAEDRKTGVQIDRISSARKFYDRGMKAFERMKFGEAAELFRMSIKQCNEFSDAWYMSAKLKYREGLFNSAYADINKAIRYFPVINRSLISAKAEEVVALKLRQKRIQNILAAEYRKMNCRSPKSEIQQYENELARIKDRIRSLGGLEKYDNSVAPEYNLFAGNICLKLGKSEEAYSEYIKAVKSNPSYSPAWTNILVLLITGKKYDTALTKLNEAEKAGAVIPVKLKEKIVELAGK